MACYYNGTHRVCTRCHAPVVETNSMRQREHRAKLARRRTAKFQEAEYVRREAGRQLHDMRQLATELLTVLETVVKAIPELSGTRDAAVRIAKPVRDKARAMGVVPLPGRKRA